ncbi:hypothetical protein H0E87_031086, partial [Populus deltoides]
MEGFLPSSMEDDVNLTSNQFDFQSLEDTFNMSELLLPPPEVPDNQSSILCNDQGGQNNVINDSIQQTTQFPTSFPETMTTMGGLDGTSSSWINQNEPNWPQTPSRHHNSFIHQPQPGHGYMTPNATTSYQPNPNLFDPQCANPMLPGPSMPLRSQYFSNQGHVDQAAVIPNIDKVQQENFVPRSQMDHLQVRGLQNQTARPNASNPGLGTSVQSQNRGLNTQQQNKGNSAEVVSHPSGCGGIGRVQKEVQVVEPGVGEERITSHAIAGNDVVSMTGMRATEDGVSEGALESRPRTEPVDPSLEQSSAVLGNLAGGAGRIQAGVQGVLEQ